MLTSSELKSHAHTRRLKLIDHIWKDYLQDMLLYLLYRKDPRFVFRGGTCIWKVMRGDRFSEDLDLCIGTLQSSFDDYLLKELGLMGFRCRIIKKKRTANMLFLKLGIASSAHQREIAISLEVLISKKCAEKKESITMYSPYPDVPPVEMLVPAREEIVADKISAIFKRDKVRDVHDLYFLIKLGARIDHESILKKVPGFTVQKLKERIYGKKKMWKSLAPIVVTKLPTLDEETRFIISKLENQ